MPREISKTSESLPAIGLNDSKVTGEVSTASGSRINGGSASFGRTEVRMMSNSSITTDLIDPIHPGEVLLEDFIKGFGITQNKLAVAIGVPPRRINEIVHGKRGITADTAVRLAKYFGSSAEFWMNLQTHYELRIQRRALQVQVDAIQPLASA